MSPTDDLVAERVLLLTPSGRDAEMILERIVADGMSCEACADLPALLSGIASGVGAAVVAREALSQAGAERLLATLDAQPPWSDIPLLLLAEAAPRERPRVVTGFFERANVTLLQRPLAIQLFLSSVRSAVRARRRQYQMRDLHRELERAVQLSDLFVSILGHDLRTPLSAIKLSAEVIVRLSPDARALRPAGRILTSADRMTRMIEQILDFARVRQGHGLTIRPREVHLGELCQQVSQELEDASPLAVFQREEKGDLSGFWDPDRLAQVLSNLLGNAVQHGSRGTPVRLEADGTDPGMVRVRVENSGAVPPELIPTLFDAFQRASEQSSSLAPRGTGLGLGLFIAREIARAHGGEITVTTEDDRTRFEVALPRDARPPIAAPVR